MKRDDIDLIVLYHLDGATDAYISEKFGLDRQILYDIFKRGLYKKESDKAINIYLQHRREQLEHYRSICKDQGGFEVDRVFAGSRKNGRHRAIQSRIRTNVHG